MHGARFACGFCQCLVGNGKKSEYLSGNGLYDSQSDHTEMAALNCCVLIF